jgi:hypothetical protein
MTEQLTSCLHIPAAPVSDAERKAKDEAFWRNWHEADRKVERISQIIGNPARVQVVKINRELIQQ